MRVGPIWHCLGRRMGEKCKRTVRRKTLLWFTGKLTGKFMDTVYFISLNRKYSSALRAEGRVDGLSLGKGGSHRNYRMETIKVL